MEEIDQHSPFDERFFLFGNDPAVMLVYTESELSHKTQRVHHVIVDAYGISASQNDRPLPHEHILRIAHAQRYDSAVMKPEEWKVELDGCDLDTIKPPFKSHFKSSECESFEIHIPPKGRLTCLSFVTGED